MSYLCSPQRPNESGEDYSQRWKNFRDANRRQVIDEYYRRIELGRISPDSDGATLQEIESSVRFYEREIRIEEGRPRPEDLPKPREWPRIEFPPDFEHESLSEISGYRPDRWGEEPWESFWNPGEFAAFKEKMAAAAAAAAAEEAESTRIHTSTGSPTTAPSDLSPRSGHKRKRGQDHDEHAEETTPVASKKKKKSRTADPTSREMGQITPTTSSRRGRSHHQEQQRNRGCEEGEDVLDEERHADRTRAAKKRRTDTGAQPPATSRCKRRRELTEDAEDDGGHAATTTSKRRRTTDRNTTGPSSGRGRRTGQGTGAPHVASPIATAVGEPSPRRTEAAGTAGAAIAIASLSAPSLLPSSSTHITRARRRHIGGEAANLFQLGHRGETCLREEAGRQEAPEAVAAANAPLTTAANNKSRQQPTNTRAKANNTANTTISRKAITKPKTRSRARARAKPKATTTHATATSAGKR